MEWLAYWSLEPPLAERLELSIAILTSVLATIHHDPKRGDAPSPGDFIPKYWTPEPEAEEDEEQEPEGMAPDKVMAAMDRLLKHQEKVGKVIERRKRDGMG